MYSSQRKVLVIGLDGVPLELIMQWINELPTLRKLIKNGAYGELKSTIPPMSGVAWSSFITGKNPGKTGIYDFLYRRKDSYTFSPINSKIRYGKSFWKILSDDGKKVGILNVPVTYPPERVNGFMVSGFMTPYTARDFTYPSNLLEELKNEIGEYKIYPDITYSEKKEHEFMEAMQKILEMRTKTTIYLMNRYKWDFFITIFFETDLVLHQLWHYIDKTHPWHNHKNEDKNPILKYLKEVDRGIQDILNGVDEDTIVMIVSDHGMGPCFRYIFLNNWLMEKGLLKLRDNLLTKIKYFMFTHGFTLVNIHKLINRLNLTRHVEYKGMYFLTDLLRRIFLSFDDVDWSKTIAYSFGRGYGSVYINLKGREPDGIVRPEEYEDVRELIIKLTNEFVDPTTGEKIVGRVLKKEEVYGEQCIDQAPDLILVPNKPTDHFFGLSDFSSKLQVEPTYRYSAIHRENGMMIVCGRNIKKGIQIKAKIEDIAPTIMYMLNSALPSDLDGRVIDEIFEKEFLSSRSHRFKETVSEINMAQEDKQSRDEEIKKKLRDLGYMG